MSAAFLRAYLHALGPSELLPRNQEDFQVMLPAYLLDKTMSEIAYELNNRPMRLNIPLRAVLHLMGGANPG